jgi:hypothetical protein
MRWLQAIIGAALILVFASVTISGAFVDTPVNAAGGCGSTSSFFGLPHWYDNLTVQQSKDGNSCAIVLTDPNSVWVIVLNVINILLRLTGIAAVIFIVLGGIRYITSQGESGGITAAKQTITRALVGLIIALVAVFIVTYVSSIFGQKVNANSNYKISTVSEANYA